MLNNIDRYHLDKKPKCFWCNRVLTDTAFQRGEAHFVFGQGSYNDIEPPELYEHTVDGCEKYTLKQITKLVNKRKRK